MWRRILERLFPSDVPGVDAAALPNVTPPASGAFGDDEDDEETDLDEGGPHSAGLPRPSGMSLEALVHRQVEQARRQGRFKNLAGSGQPLPGLDHHDPDWWVRRKLAEEGADLGLSPALDLRRDLPGELDRLRRLRDEEAVRAGLLALNARIRKVNSHHVAGPPSNVIPFDVDAWLRDWRAARGDGEAPST